MSALLKTQKLTIKFGGLVAVNDLNLEIRKGELVGLIGPNGAGKTTCFNLLTGVYTPTGGEILYQGKNIAGTSPHHICHLGICRTFQNIRLFKKITVLENVMVALHPERQYNLFQSLLALPGFRRGEAGLREKAMELLKAVGLEKKADQLAQNLPYGEQRKLEIARALGTRPQLLLLDEPAAGMNPKETEELCEVIQHLRTDFGVTILLIEHDMSLVMKICERIYVLDYGVTICEGKPEKIKNDPKVIEAYLGGAIGTESGTGEHANDLRN